MNGRRKILAYPLVAVILSVWILYEGLDQPPENTRAYAFANGTVAVMLALSVIWLAGEAMKLFRTTPGPIAWRPVGGGLIGIAAYVLLIPMLGMWLASLLLYFVIGYAYNGSKNDTKSQLTTVFGGLAFMLVLYALFNWLLQVQMAQGWLELI